MRALVTGANGFIGSNLAAKLKSKGVSVRGLVRKTSDLSFIKGLKIELFFGDLRDTASLKKAMKNVDVIFHVAALASDWGDFKRFREINVMGTENLIHCAIENKVRRIIYVSSVSVFGFCGYVDGIENVNVAKTNFPYCITKLEGEKVVQKYSFLDKIEAVIIRPGIVYGPNDRTTFLKFAKVIDNGFCGYINGGKSLMCPVYIDDLVSAIILAAKIKETDGQIYTIVDGGRTTWKEFLHLIAKEMGTKPLWISIPGWIAYSIAAISEFFMKLFRSPNPPILTKYRISLASKDFHFSIDKARRELKYNPKYDIKRGIKNTVRWYREYKKKLHSPQRPGG